MNTGLMTFSVVAISLTLGTLGGYALSRSGFRYAFWILIIALVFRAMPHITLVSGYLLPFFEMNLLGTSDDNHHRDGGNQSAVYTVDAAFLLPQHP